ncbi:MAG: divalent-cation tolerance protein CutA [Gemmatimonadota bacterium]|nr:divalent-cation tolerance protein CutA [Gemmatimonadota bacterium]
MGEPSTPPVVVLVTGPDEATMTSIARLVVEEGLAACVNVIPGVQSVYRWDETVQLDQEALAVFKTTRPALAALERRVLSLHPYDLPEFLVIPVDSGSEPYVHWITRSVSVEAGS